MNVCSALEPAAAGSGAQVVQLSLCRERVGRCPKNSGSPGSLKDANAVAVDGVRSRHFRSLLRIFSPSSISATAAANDFMQVSPVGTSPQLRGRSLWRPALGRSARCLWLVLWHSSYVTWTSRFSTL